jgi:BlaI family penicillinase repressor
MARLPDLSGFELQCLRRLWAHGEATVRQLHEELPDPPTYSTVRKIFERLEEKRAIRRVRKEGKAWVYRPAIARTSMMRKEVRRFLDSMFDGSVAGLMDHLADVDALSLDDLREVEKRLGKRKR